MPRPCERFAEAVEVATYEFENLPVAPLEALGDKLGPATRSLAVAQDRAVEKQFIEHCGAPRRPVAKVSTSPTSARPSSSSACRSCSKTRRYGYDGKGQA